MCYTAKLSVTSWWILAMMSLFLWYRNQLYDRALALFVLALGFIQLIEYGIHSGADPNQSGKALFIILWLQCLVLSVGTFIFINSKIDPSHPSTKNNVLYIIAGWTAFIFCIIFLIMAIYCLVTGDVFSGIVGDTGHIEWSRNCDSLLGYWGWVYLLGIFVPLMVLLFYYGISSIGIGVVLLILYGIFSAIYVITNYPPKVFSSMWCYLSIGFAFLAWMVGITDCQK